MKKIYVDVSKPYNVLVGNGLLQSMPELIKPVCSSNQIAIVTDNKVAELYLDDLENSLKSLNFRVHSFVFHNGEQSKNINTLSDILEFLAFHHIRRNDTILAFGGGVVGDITGMAAAIYMRGISVIQIPTTLLSAVDSSVGGKTAIDLKNGKNLAGAFWQPSMVICDVDVIRQLPFDIFKEGMAEVIKCNVIKELPILKWIEEETLTDHLEVVITSCVSLKRDIVELDEFDSKGIRNILNVGHTIAHAIEKLSDYKISHGHAVGTGMVFEAKMALQLGICDDNTVEQIENAVNHYDLMVDIPWNHDLLSNTMLNDKKNRDNRIVFELPSKLGNCQEIILERDEASTIIKNIIGDN